MTLQREAPAFNAGGGERIHGIFNYCDRRCERCRFASRCSLRAQADEDDEHYPDSTLTEVIQRNLTHTVALIKHECKARGIDFDAVAAQADDPKEDPDRVLRDPLVLLGREYANLVHPIMSALEPVVARRHDPALTEAASSIGWSYMMIASKIFRAVVGLDDEPEQQEIQTDFNGSAKIARILVAESIAAWRVLMETGKAAADGVPAKAVAMLEKIDGQLAERFPRAHEFIRPGFDEPEEKL